MAANFIGANRNTMGLTGQAAEVATGAFRHQHRRMLGHAGNEGRHEDVNDAFFGLQAVFLQVQTRHNSSCSKDY